jgi:hypothetical protein
MVKTCRKFLTTWFSHLATTMERKLSRHPIFTSHHCDKTRIKQLLDLHLSPLWWSENWAIAQFSWPTTTKERESGGCPILMAHHYKVRESCVYSILMTHHHEGEGWGGCLIFMAHHHEGGKSSDHLILMSPN